MSEKAVLIIDDDQTLVGALKEGLESLGYSVNAAFDGLQGILQAHQNKPDAIMLDFNMPAGGGADVYERLRSSTDTGKIPIIFLTGATVEEVKNKIRTTPNTFFLRKPVSVAQMRKVLDKIIGSTRSSQAPPPAPSASEPADPFLPMPPAGPPSSPPSPVVVRKESYAGLSLPGEKVKTPPPPAPMPVSSPAPAVPAASAGGGKKHSFGLRVTYADTDRLGIVYYANYFKFFEQGRTELLRQCGLRYRDLEMSRQVFLPVVESHCEYLAPSRYDDPLIVRTWVNWLGRASVCFRNEVSGAEEPDRVLVNGYTRHAVLNAQWKPMPVPRDIRDKLSSYLISD